MIEAGVLQQEDRVELLNGVMIEMSPQDERHVRAMVVLNAALVRGLPDAFQVRPQAPLTFLPDNEPEPDLAVVRESDLLEDQHPSAAVVVIEVSGSSLRKDRRVKSAIYARAGVPEYWIVNLVDSAVEVHRDPDASAARYQTLVTLRSGEVVSSALLPGFSIAVAKVVGA